MVHRLLLNTDQLLTVQGIQDAVSGSYLSTGTVTATLLELDGTQVTGQTWPLTLSYVTGSNGDWRGVLQDTNTLVAGRHYHVKISIDSSGSQRNFRFRAKAVHDTP